MAAASPGCRSGADCGVASIGLKAFWYVRCWRLGEWGRAGLGAPGVEQEGGEPGRGAGVGAGGLGGVGGWSSAEVLVGELPKTEARKFLVGVPGQGRAGRDGSGGGAGVGLGGGWVEWEGGPKHGPFGGTWWECASTEKRQFLVGFLDRVE